jgi:hypothetical protein
MLRAGTYCQTLYFFLLNIKNTNQFHEVSIYIDVICAIVTPPVDYISNPNPITDNWPARRMKSCFNARIYRIDFFIRCDCQRPFAAKYWVNSCYLPAHYPDFCCVYGGIQYDK